MSVVRPDPPLLYDQGAGQLNQIQLWWDAPVYTGGYPISNYNLLCRELSYNRSFPAVTETVVIPVPNGIDYYFSITATNTRGLTSAPAYFDVVSGGTTPDCIKTVSVNVVSSYYAVVSWTTEAVPNMQFVHSYLVYAVPSTATLSTLVYNAYGDARSFDFIGYTSSYSFYVVACGTGALWTETIISTPVTAMGLAPLPVTDVNIVINDPTQVTVTWGGGFTATSYKFQIFPDDGSPPFFVTGVLTDGKVIFTDCSSWINYRYGPGYGVKVIAVNGGGETESAITVIHFGPLPPSSLTYRDITPSSFTLVWRGANGDFPGRSFQYSLDCGSTIINNTWSPNPYGNSNSGISIFTGFNFGSTFRGAVVYAINGTSTITTASRAPYSSFILLPGAMTNLTPSLISQSSFTLSWGGLQGASTVVYSGALTPTIANNGVVGPAVYTSLYPGSTYSIVITSLNRSGYGAPGLITLKTVCLPVASVEQGVGSLSSLLLTWSGTLGADYYIPIVNGVSGSPVNAAISTVVYPGLQANTLYSTAIVAYGNLWSSYYISTYSEYYVFTTAPKTPAIPSISSLSNSSFTLVWTVEPSTIYTVYVNGKPFRPAYSPLTYSSLTTNTPYDFLIVGTNNGGSTSSMMSTVTTKAGPLSGVGVSSIGSSSFTLTWSGGEGASNYVFSLDGGSTFVTAPYYPNPYGNVSSGYATFLGLPIGNKYNGVIVYAVNPGGYTSSLAYSNVTLLPGAATNLTPSLFSPSSFRLTWGGVQGATSLAYLGDSVPTGTNGVTGPAVYTDLFPGSYYNVVLVPSNSSGAGVAASTLIKTTPGLVTNITQRLGTGVSLNIAWYDAAGAENYGYLVGGVLSGPIYGSTIFSAIIGGLTPNTIYSTSVVAYATVWPSGGLVGSTLSNYVNFTTGSAAARNLVISDPGAEYFSIGWSGAEGASSLTFHYNNSTLTVATPVANPYLISGLTINTSYTVYIDSANAYGITSSMSIIQITGLGPPVLSTVALTAYSFTVTWSGVDTASSITFNCNGITTTLSQGSVSTYLVSGLMPNTYYPITAVARNLYSSSISQQYVQLTAPTLPTNVVVSGITGNQMVISWSDGITSSLTFRYGSSKTTISGSVASPYTITNLTSNTPYVIYLEVTNAVANLSTVAFTKTTGPSAPVNLVISNVTATQFDVAWSGAVAATNLTFYYNSSNVSVNTPVTSPRTLTGLIPNTPYTVYMVASNTNGVTSSLSVSQTTGPGAPTNLVASGIGDTYFSVGWSGAAGASSLTFTYGGQTITANAIGVQNPYPFTSGLTVGNTYTVYVVARNSICATSSLGLSVTTVYPPPSQPTNLQQTAASDGDVTITWSQLPPITSYTWYRDQWSGYPTAIGNVRTLTVGGFGNDTETTLFLKPINSNVNGPQANITCYTNPSVPSLSQTSAGYTSVTVSVNPFRPFYQYTYSCNGQNNIDFTGNANPTVNFSNPVSNVTFYMTVKNGNFASQQNSIVVNTQPVQPSDLRQTGATTTSVSLSWNSLSGLLTGLTWNVGGGPSGSLSNNATSYNITSGLNSNSQYNYFNLYAVNNSVSSSPASVTITTNPDTPTLSQQSATYNSVTISVNYYPIYQYAYSYDGGSYTSFSGNSFVINPGSPFASKSLIVRASNGSFGSASATLNINTAPGLISISQNAVSYSSFTVNISGYQYDSSNTLYWSGSDSTSGNVSLSGQPATQLVTSGISQAGNITYTIYVKSQNSYGNTNSNTLSVTTRVGPPPTPTGLRVTTIQPYQVRFTWDALGPVTSGYTYAYAWYDSNGNMIRDYYLGVNGEGFYYAPYGIVGDFRLDSTYKQYTVIAINIGPAPDYLHSPPSAGFTVMPALNDSNPIGVYGKGCWYRFTYPVDIYNSGGAIGGWVYNLPNSLDIYMYCSVNAGVNNNNNPSRDLEDKVFKIGYIPGDPGTTQINSFGILNYNPWFLGPGNQDLWGWWPNNFNPLPGRDLIVAYVTTNGRNLTYYQSSEFGAWLLYNISPQALECKFFANPNGVGLTMGYAWVDKSVEARPTYFFCWGALNGESANQYDRTVLNLGHPPLTTNYPRYTIRVSSAPNTSLARPVNINVSNLFYAILLDTNGLFNDSSPRYTPSTNLDGTWYSI